jgi:hypothetical protein
VGLIFGGITYPLVAQAAAQPVVSVADPFLSKALPYWQTCIETYCVAAYAAVMTNQTEGAINRACKTTLAIDPLPWIDVQTIQPPVLALYPVEEVFGRLTLEHDQTVTDYKLAYVLPAVTYDRFKALAPMLQAVFRLIVAVTEQQHDAAYDSDARVWDDAETVAVTFGKVQYGQLESADKIGHFMPAFFADVNVAIRGEYYRTDAVTMTDQEVTVDEGTSEDGLLTDAVVGLESVG